MDRIIKFAAVRKDARVVEWDGLENRYTGNCIESSNLSPSANKSFAAPPGAFFISIAGPKRTANKKINASYSVSSMAVYQPFYTPLPGALNDISTLHQQAIILDRFNGVFDIPFFKKTANFFSAGNGCGAARRSCGCGC